MYQLCDDEGLRRKAVKETITHYAKARSFVEGNGGCPNYQQKRTLVKMLVTSEWHSWNKRHFLLQKAVKMMTLLIVPCFPNSISTFDILDISYIFNKPLIFGGRMETLFSVGLFLSTLVRGLARPECEQEKKQKQIRTLPFSASRSDLLQQASAFHGKVPE